MLGGIVFEEKFVGTAHLRHTNPNPSQRQIAEQGRDAPATKQDAHGAMCG
jgi:hypothetical protein